MQENNTIKVESNVAVVTEEDSIGIKPDEVYTHSAYCVKIAEPKVSLILDKFWFVSPPRYNMFVTQLSVRGMYMMHSMQNDYQESAF